MTDIVGIVAAYYPRIDAVDLNWVVALLAATATYQRADTNYAGRASIDHFFRVERQIRGSHIINQL